MRNPPVSLVISCCTSSRALLRAAFTPEATRSSSIVTSSSPVFKSSTTCCSILIETTSCLPLATTVTIPPPTVASTVFSPKPSCNSTSFSCIFWACFIILPKPLFIIINILLAHHFIFIHWPVPHFSTDWALPNVEDPPTKKFDRVANDRRPGQRHQTLLRRRATRGRETSSSVRCHSVDDADCNVSPKGCVRDLLQCTQGLIFVEQLVCHAMIALEDNLQDCVGNLDLTMLFQNPAKGSCARTLDNLAHEVRSGEWLLARFRHGRRRRSHGNFGSHGCSRHLNNWLLLMHSVCAG